MHHDDNDGDQKLHRFGSFGVFLVRPTLLAYVGGTKKVTKNECTA